MKLLLDTHAFVWLASSQRHLPAAAQQALRASAGHLFLSSISALEIALLSKRKRLQLPLPPDDYVERALLQHGIEEVPVDRRIAVLSSALPDLHNDPFDRLIIATARLGGMVILTKDGKFGGYGVRTLWRRHDAGADRAK